jgi:hypothetical protein
MRWPRFQKAAANPEQHQDDFTLPEGMTVYYMGLQKRGPAWKPDVTPEIEQLQAEPIGEPG